MSHDFRRFYDLKIKFQPQIKVVHSFTSEKETYRKTLFAHKKRWEIRTIYCHPHCHKTLFNVIKLQLLCYTFTENNYEVMALQT